MDELIVRIDTENHIIQTNFGNIEAQLKEVMNGYNIVVDENSIKESKKDLADLRKMKDEIDKKRKEVKKEWNKPYVEFEDRCKKLMALIDKPIEQINAQLKMFDEERILKKQEHIKEIYEKNIDGLEKFLPLEKIFNPKWNNVSYDDGSIIYDLQEMTFKVKRDIESIKALGSEIEEECIKAYLDSNNDLASAIKRNAQYLADKNKVIEQVKEEVEEKAKEETIEETIKEAKEEVPTAIDSLNDFVEMTKTVHFIVSETDAEQVRELLGFSNIKFREE